MLVAGLALAATSQVSAGYEFELFEFPAAPITGGRGINDTGCVAGYYQTDAANFLTAHALRRCSGILETVDPPTSTGDRRAFDINDAGTLVGSALRARGNDAFELSGTSYTWVVYPGAGQTVIRGINNHGDVVGEYENLDGIRRAFMRIGGVFTNIDVPASTGSRARAINDSGDIVGHYDDMAGDRHGFLRTAAGVYTTLDYPGAAQTVTGGIDNAGNIVGTYFDGGGVPHGFLLTTRGYEPLDVPGAAGTLAIGINEAGQITGEYDDGLGTRRGFVATPHVFADGFESGTVSAWSTSQP